MGLALYERLLLLDATLKSVPPEVVLEQQRARGESDEHGVLTMGLDLLASRRFLALEFETDGGRRIPVFGRLAERPPLTGRDRDDLRANLPLIRTISNGMATARTFLLRRLDRGDQVHGTLVGEVSPDFLWGSLTASLPSPNTVITVTDEISRPLFQSTQADLVSQADPINEAAPMPSSQVPAEPGSAERPYVTSSSPLLLDEVFSAPTWTLTLSESEDEVLGPLARFSRLFAWIIVISGLAVLVLSGSQIRRSLVPLVELREGTRRIAHRDFASRVTVTSRDEFEELASSFNAMAVQLGRQFQALSTAAELDRAVLSATDVASIVDTLLARTRDVFPCHVVGVTLVGPDGGKSLSGVLYDYCDEMRHTTRVELRSEDVQDLLDGPDLISLEPTGDPLPAYLVPMARLGPRTILVLPLRFRRQLVGILVLGERTGESAGADEQVQIRRLADQVAVALANVQMLEQVKSLAYFDSLTGLPNRLSYKERLAQALEQARRGGKLVAAFFIDLDHFSRINDTLGHEAGDQLLQQVALRLRASCRDREDEVGLAQEALADVARLGGDEFTVIMPGLARADDAGKLARRILSSMATATRPTRGP